MAWVVWAGQDQLGSSAKTPSALVLGLLSCSPLCCWASICPARSPPPLRRRRCLGLALRPSSLLTRILAPGDLVHSPGLKYHPGV